MVCLRLCSVAVLTLAALAHARDAADFDEVIPSAESAKVSVESPQPEALYISSRRRFASGYAGGGRYNSGGYSSGYHNSGGGSHTVISHTTAGDEVKNAFTRACIGFFIFIFAFPVLWFNEGREAHMWILFGRARSMFRSVSDQAVDPNNEAALVCISGVSGTDDTLSDDNFPVQVQNCTKLEREVQMYQWAEQTSQEERDDNRGGKETITTYTYNQGWYPYHIDSSSFNDTSYKNPPLMPYESTKKTASYVSLGAFQLSKRLIQKTCNYQACGGSELGSMNGFSEYEGCGFTNCGQGTPFIGALRVTFRKVPCGDTSVLALQHNDSFAPFLYKMQVQNGKVVSPTGNTAPLLDAADNLEIEFGNPTDICSAMCSGCSLVGQCIQSHEEIYELAEQTMDGNALLDRAISSQVCFHKVMKLVGFVMLFAGLDMMGTFLPTIFRFIPFAGTWIQWILNGAVHIFSFLMAGFLFLVTVAIAWLRYRPMKAALLFAAAIAVIVGITLLSQQSC
eukprot:TRINITY_DN64240_c0_g1_i1.p1 TRINITY_DN64240_c0_g1~~TRINITY_DN64240_c0_g1_i1.p1  ORF type:complete len:509 (+),score=84.24 TRINITY_DN64240_c0_g1_i1:57-1583(+)